MPRGDELRGDRAGGHRRALEEGELLAPVIGPGPGLLAGRRVPPERRVGAKCHAGRDRGAERHRAGDRRAGQCGQAEAGGALHFLSTVFLTFPVALGVGVPGTVGVTLGTGNGTGLTAEAPEIP